MQLDALVVPFMNISKLYLIYYSFVKHIMYSKQIYISFGIGLQVNLHTKTVNKNTKFTTLK